MTTRRRNAILLLAALAIGGALESLTPDTDVHARPFTRRGEIGQPVDGRTFEATVLSVRGAARFAVQEIAADDRELDTAGVWVVVKVRAVAKHETTTIGYAALRDAAGRTYLASTRVDQPLVEGGRELQPGIPVEGDIVFEVPREAAGTGLAVLLAEPAIDRRLDAQVEVPLPVDRRVVDQWLRIPLPGQVSEARVVT